MKKYPSLLELDLNEVIEKHWTEAVLQCAKDTGIYLKAESSFDTVKNQISTEIASWLDKNPEKLAQTLYRSDISKAQAQNIFFSKKDENEPGIWAEILLRKSLLKVLLRQEFNSK